MGDSKSVGNVVKAMNKEVDTAMKDGLFEMAGLGVDAIKAARDYLAKTIKTDIKTYKKDTKKAFKTATKTIKKMITNRNLDLDSTVKEEVYDAYVTFVSDFEETYYDNVDDNLFKTLPYTDFNKQFKGEANAQR